MRAVSVAVLTVRIVDAVGAVATAELTIWISYRVGVEPVVIEVAEILPVRGKDLRAVGVASIVPCNGRGGTNDGKGG